MKLPEWLEKKYEHQPVYYTMSVQEGFDAACAHLLPLLSECRETLARIQKLERFTIASDSEEFRDGAHQANIQAAELTTETIEKLDAALGPRDGEGEGED